MVLLASSVSTLMLLAGLLLLAWILMRRSYRYFGRPARAAAAAGEPKPRPYGAAASSLPAGAPVEFLRWHVEMHETARDLKAELDSKMGALQQLLLMAAEQHQRLEQSIARAREVGLVEPPEHTMVTTNQDHSKPAPPS